MSLQCITPTIGLVADQKPDHFVSVSIVSLPSYGCHPSYDHVVNEVRSHPMLCKTKCVQAVRRGKS